MLLLLLSILYRLPRDQSQENRAALKKETKSSNQVVVTDPGRDIVEGIDARATKAKFKATWRDGNEKKMEKEARRRNSKIFKRKKEEKYEPFH